MYNNCFFFVNLYMINLRAHFRVMREWRSILLDISDSNTNLCLMTKNHEALLCRSFGDFEN